MAVAVAVLSLGLSSSPAAAADVAFACNPAPANCSGWYRQPVRVKWFVPPSYDTLGCNTRTYSTDTKGVSNRCRATSGAVTVDITLTIHVDRTPPTIVGGATGRPPDHGGWWIAPVDVGFTGTDATSGIASCTALTYSGPDSATASVPGTCTDVAGNVSPTLAFPLPYDATPPAITLSALPGDRRVELSWTTSPDTASVELVRTSGRGARTPKVLYQGTGATFTNRRVRNGRRYRYRLTAIDQAGNRTEGKIAARPGRRLLAPAAGARVTAPPALTWTAVRGARYYNVQLFRKGRKLLSAWPSGAGLQLPASWRFGGRTQRLRAGTYRWYVWPGRGARSARSYGALVGSRTFVIR